MVDLTLLKELHEFSTNHRKQLEKCTSLACFYCLNYSNTSEVKEWIDKEQTALCPRCGIDACIPPGVMLHGTELEITKDILRAMYSYWFGRTTTMEEHKISGDISTGLELLQRRSYDLAVTKGFWTAEQKANPDKSWVPEKLMLIVSELAEAMEDYRAGKDLKQVVLNDSGKPEGFPTELADAVIRIMDLAEALDIPLAETIEQKHLYNTTRPFKHGKVC